MERIDIDLIERTNPIGAARKPSVRSNSLIGVYQDVSPKKDMA